MEIGIEERCLAIEVLANLIHIKNTMVKLILKPAGVPPEVYIPLLYQRDEGPERTLSKRKIAPLILQGMQSQPDSQVVLRRIIEIAAHWSNFHLAVDEFLARANVQKARELFGTIELMEARETRQREITRKEQLARMERERAEMHIAPRPIMAGRSSSGLALLV